MGKKKSHNLVLRQQKIYQNQVLRHLPTKNQAPIALFFVPSRQIRKQTHMKQFLDMPLWLSIPLAVTYILAWAGFIYTIYYHSNWRQRRLNKNNKK